MNSQNDFGTNEGLLFFVHLPRTGGTTLHELLASRFSAEETLRSGDRAELVDELRGRSPEERAALRLVTGPYDSTVAGALDRPARLVTMLREPVARTMSAYEYIKSTAGHPLHAAANEMTFAAFLQSPGGTAVSDQQTRWLAGTATRAPHRSTPLPGVALLERAKRQLESFAYFGLRERFAESAVLLADTLDWAPFAEIPTRAHSGVTNHRLALNASELEIVQERNRLDLELYRFARRHFLERLEAVTQAPRHAPHRHRTVSAA